MRDHHPEFADRSQAGRQLADVLQGKLLSQAIIVALPRGGVPVGFEMAQRLGLPLDLLIVAKIGAPGHPEFGIGAVADGPEPHVVIDEQAARRFPLPPGYLDTEMRHQLAEVERRHRMYFGEDQAEDHDFRGHDIVLVDDGIANGGSIFAGIEALKHMGAGRIVVAVPVASQRLVEELRQHVAEVICLSSPQDLEAVSLHYDDFTQTTDQQVVDFLRQARNLDRRLH
jgi:putative phosphoribosyl transferase